MLISALVFIGTYGPGAAAYRKMGESGRNSVLKDETIYSSRQRARCRLDQKIRRVVPLADG
ncbi:hypothetical protein LSH36_685g00047 [Paralvinella palmiformis]|uniref:Uncharacterized protein n=1 Tax=Paralvinella palmiformis TaxID=53620 RepID=A0AAD9MVI6_9ANNE|nr:hypothetical protein LSH36_685g00047 [Paralvinella palmiformis]